ncbi:MAG: hypothetical protein E7356_03310 [Clostridiales bacterium]|nr:hypothetical protein [Clostridiales bacterium]
MTNEQLIKIINEQINSLALASYYYNKNKNNPLLTSEDYSKNAEVALIYINNAKDALTQLRTTLVLEDTPTRAETIVESFRRDFQNMTYEERESYLQSFGFDFGSNPIEDAQQSSCSAQKIVDDFKLKFGAMSEDERIEFMKANGFKFAPQSLDEQYFRSKNTTISGLFPECGKIVIDSDDLDMSK